MNCLKGSRRCRRVHHGGHLAGLLLLATHVVCQAQGFEWARQFGGVGFQAVNGLTIGLNGDVISAGGFANTVDFDPGVGVSNFTSNGSSDIFVSRLDSLGHLVWTRQMGGTQYEAAFAISSDTAGNIVLAGDFRGTVDFDPGPGVFNLTAPPIWGDIFYLKLDANGNFLWAKAVGGSGRDVCQGLTLDPAGNLYAVGYFESTVDFDPGPGSFPMTSAGMTDVYITKLDAAGAFVWAKRVGGNLDDRANDVVVDAAGNIFYCGSFQTTVDFDPGTGSALRTTVGATDIYVSKLDPQGNFAWVDQIGGSVDDVALDVEVDPSGNIYAAGEFSNTVDFDPGPAQFNLTTPGNFGAFFMQLDPAGNFVWAKAIHGPNSIPSAWVRDGAGNFVATGTFQTTTDFDPGPGTLMMSPVGNFDAYVLKLDALGNFVWALSFGGTLNDWGHAIAVDADDHIYSGGYFDQTVDFDPGGGVYNLTAILTEDAYVHKLGACTVPAAPTNTTSPLALTVCAGGTATLTATGSGLLSWHDVPNGGTALGTGNNFTTPPLSASTTYYVQDYTCAIGPRIPITVTVLQNSYASLTETACRSYLSPSGNHVWTSSGNYTDTLTNLQGCDSIVTVNLSIQQSASLINATHCSSYTSPSGQVWTLSGTYHDTIPNVHGCDSVITVALTIHSPSATQLTATACDSYLGPSGQIWTTSGNYVDTLANQWGCDSTVTVNLTVRNSSTSMITAMACDSFLSPGGLVWSSSGNYWDTIPNALGCDSIIAVQLTIGQSGNTTISPVACDQYTSPTGQIWTSSGLYIDTLTTQSGCDSVVTIHLTVNTVDASVTNTPPTATANAVGATYQWMYCDSALIPGATQQSFTATATGNYAVIVTQNGCTDTSACQDIAVVGMADQWMGWRVYPNPTTGLVHVDCGGYCDGLVAEVRNALGQLVVKEFTVAAGKITVALQASPGVYFLTLQTDDGRNAHFRIVKQ